MGQVLLLFSAVYQINLSTDKFVYFSEYIISRSLILSILNVTKSLNFYIFVDKNRRLSRFYFINRAINYVSKINIFNNTKIRLLPMSCPHYVNNTSRFIQTNLINTNIYNICILSSNYKTNVFQTSNTYMHTNYNTCDTTCITIGVYQYNIKRRRKKIKKMRKQFKKRLLRIIR